MPSESDVMTGPITPMIIVMTGHCNDWAYDCDLQIFIITFSSQI